MRVKRIREDILEYLETHQLLQKWEKAKKLFERDIRHPSLHVELLEPKWHGIYSFRIDQRYRALFFIDDGEAEVFKMTVHYKK